MPGAWDNRAIRQDRRYGRLSIRAHPPSLVAFIGELGAGPGEHVHQQTSRTAGAGANSCFTDSGWRVIGL